MKYSASTLNQLLDSCTVSTTWKLGMEIYEYAIENDCEIDEITFGTLVKCYGHKKDL